MDSLSNQNNCQVNSNGSRMMAPSSAANTNGTNSQPNASTDLRHTYTIAGIVQFLQYEWQRFEIHRQQWEVEKSELQARIALLQGERKGQENLKNDLIRRIKMLEYCLRQERAKYHKLKYGVDPPNLTNSPEEVNDLNFELEENLNSENPNTVNWKQGRQLLRHYLQEIGYTDTIIDVRSNRVRSLLGLSNINEELTSEQAVNKVLNQSQYMQTKKKKDLMNPSNMMVNDAESSVLATFEFLNNQTDNGMMEGIEVEDEDVIDNDGGAIANDETEEVMNEFDMIINNRMELNERELATWKQNVSKDVDIGELASLTETNNVIECNNTSVNSESKKTWSQKYILKSHFDCIRSLRFHATEPLLITASEDETLKLWNLNKTQQSNKNKQQINTGNATLDLEPVYTYRGHTSAVLSLCLNGNMFYSGSQNGEIITWSIPPNVMSLDPYDPYDSKLQMSNMMAHKDAVWALAFLHSPVSAAQILCSASADKSIKVWDTARSICLKNIECGEDIAPTDLVTLYTPNLNSSASSSSFLVSSYTDGSMSLFDIEAHTNTPLLSFDKVPNSGSIYSLTSHPTMPIVISAHQDRHIRLWDINTGKCIHSMVAHLDAVTSVDCDPNGLYLLSGSHDCSVRLWNFDIKKCVQEITSHRKKFDEAIFDVTFHPSKPYFASAGADGLAKIFV